jgi:hypothetical protein
MHPPNVLHNKPTETIAENAYARSLFLLSPVTTRQRLFLSSNRPYLPASPIFWVVDFSCWGWIAEATLDGQLYRDSDGSSLFDVHVAPSECMAIRLRNPVLYLFLFHPLVLMRFLDHDAMSNRRDQKEGDLRVDSARNGVRGLFNVRFLRVGLSGSGGLW